MGNNTEKKRWTVAKNHYKFLRKKNRSDNLINFSSGKSDNNIGSNREKSNIEKAFCILFLGAPLFFSPIVFISIWT